MLKPTINIGEAVITLPCALKDIGNFTVDKETILEYNHDGIDALSVRIYCDGRRTASVGLDNRDKDLPLEEKTIVDIFLFENTEFHGIRCYYSKWEDACETAGRLDCIPYGNLLAPLENGYYLDCRKSFDEGTVTEMTVYTAFDNAEKVDRALAKYRS